MPLDCVTVLQPYDYMELTFLNRSYRNERCFPSWQCASAYVRPFVRASFIKNTIMFRKQTAEPRSANFCVLLHVDNIRWPINFHRNRHLHFKGQIFQSSTFWSSCVIISQTATNRTNVAFDCQQIESRLACLHLTLAHFKGQGQTFRLWISRKWWQIWQTLLLP